MAASEPASLLGARCATTGFTIIAELPNCGIAEFGIAYLIPQFDTSAIRQSIDDADAAASAQLFDARDEGAVWSDIIAFRLEHDHEVAAALDVKEEARFATALRAQRMEFVDGDFRAA